MNRPTTTLYGFSFSHHGVYSSFHRLLHYSQAHRIIDVRVPFSGFLNSRLAAQVERRWRRLAEWQLRPIFARTQRQCVHYLYPENSFFCGGKWKKLHKVIVSCHQPPIFLEGMKTGGQSVFFDALDQADRVVLLAESFRSGYEQFCEKSKIRVIRHGVDVHFFQPTEQPKERPLIITVGNWLRDYDFWQRVIIRLGNQMPNVEFAVVALPGVVSEFYAKAEKHLGKRVRLLHGLSDQELRNLYKEASVLFLPLKDAGANNALLEAMSCGLPILVNDLSATREYVGDKAFFFTLGDIDMCVTKLAGLLQDEEHQAILSAESRQRVIKHFSWEVIASQYDRLYAEVLQE